MTCLMSRLKVVLLDVSSISGRYKHEIIYGAEGTKYHRLALILNHFLVYHGLKGLNYFGN